MTTPFEAVSEAQADLHRRFSESLQASIMGDSKIWKRFGGKEFKLSVKHPWLHPIKWLIAKELTVVFKEGHIEKWLDRNGYVKEDDISYYKRVTSEILKHLGLEEDYVSEKHFLKKTKKGKK